MTKEKKPALGLLIGVGKPKAEPEDESPPAEFLEELSDAFPDWSDEQKTALWRAVRCC